MLLHSTFCNADKLKARYNDGPIVNSVVYRSLNTYRFLEREDLIF